MSLKSVMEIEDTLCPIEQTVAAHLTQTIY